MTREQKYAEQLRALGIYHELYDPEIHTLAIMEREHQRTLTAWKKAGSDTADELYAVIVQQRRDILAHRDALGLTPKAMRRFRAQVGEEKDERRETVLELMRARYKEA